MRNVELSLESGEDLDVRSFNVQESMSAAFRVDLVARSHADALDLGAIAGKAASFLVRDPHGDRVWSGVCAHAAQSAVETEGLSTYQIQVVPTLWLLTQRTGHRLFQHLSAPEIAEKLLREWRIPVELRLSQRHPRSPMSVQYGETDYDFFRRLLAEAGISFFFAAADGQPTAVVLSDAPETAAPRPAAPTPFASDSSLMLGVPHVSDVEVSSRVVAARVTFRDHDFRRPRHALTGTHAAGASPHALLEDYRHAPGHSLAEASTARGAASEPMADGGRTYRHQDSLAAARAQRHAEALRAGQVRIAFSTTRLDLAPGSTFSIAGHPHPEVAAPRELLVTHAWLNGDVGAAWHAGGRAVPANRPFRPVFEDAGPDELVARCGPFEPLGRTRKPRIFGVQSAIVTGPPGADVHADEHGRVTVHFPWDREGERDEKSSPWVRVSQAWTGAAHGMHTLPRVGHEVLVAFHGGDPDHPMVVGRLHNATSPAPYPLPEHKARTSIVTGSAAGSNEVTFDDAPGHELFYVQASADLHKIVENDELEHTRGDRHIHVDGDLAISAGGRITLHSQGDLAVKGGPHVKLNPGETPRPAKKPKPLSTPKAKDGDPYETLNARLAHISPGDLPESDATAREYKSNAEKYQHDAELLGKKYGVPPALILALMNRETRFGTLLVDGWGDSHHGFGILQVDNRSHTPVGGPLSLAHMNQAMGIFVGGLHEMQSAHPGWSADQQLAGAVAAYNSGAGNVATQPTSPATWAQMDQGTYQDDYSRDVWAQAQWFSKNLAW